MIKPQAFKLKCPNCKYERLVRPKSDSLNIMDIIQHCPKCNILMERTRENVKE